MGTSSGEISASGAYPPFFGRWPPFCDVFPAFKDGLGALVGVCEETAGFFGERRNFIAGFIVFYGL